MINCGEIYDNSLHQNRKMAAQTYGIVGKRPMGLSVRLCLMISKNIAVPRPVDLGTAMFCLVLCEECSCAVAVGYECGAELCQSTCLVVAVGVYAVFQSIGYLLLPCIDRGAEQRPKL